MPGGAAGSVVDGEDGGTARIAPGSARAQQLGGRDVVGGAAAGVGLAAVGADAAEFGARAGVENLGEIE